ncbi:hypothetical protein BCIN_07g00850 [Botrytis cinerea B05.10]|uniref:Uncharacterized protein n=1 Tax=Botryotinia fuckeliana (strain B05.10) TaxID=332648 RepID=A0A384JLI9_BOTFB|nr:hypothetical protein BCIN_07g00850 [Botrytis cinerea B05.10]ATZ51449.1 hypothetical protein BCIN_07g00850 [Botrytis cinerea B05.10]
MGYPKNLSTCVKLQMFTQIKRCLMEQVFIRPYSIHVRVKSAAAFNDDAPQYQLQLRHDDEQQQDSAGRTKTNPERLDMSATG